MEMPEVVSQAKTFGREASLLGDRIKIEGEAPMTLAQAKVWIAKQRSVQCPKCGAYR